MKKPFAILISAMFSVCSHAQTDDQFWTEFASVKYGKAEAISYTMIY